jgi:hypothetical protein
MDDAPLKIPSTCRCCDSPLSRGDMEYFLRLCEVVRRDPLEVAFSASPRGATCRECMTRMISKGVEEGDPRALGILEAVHPQLRGDRRTPLP